MDGSGFRLLWLAKDGNNRQNVLAVRGSSPASVQPLWDDLRIEDVYSAAQNSVRSVSRSLPWLTSQ